MSPVKNYNGLYLGKHPARKGAVKLRLSDYVDIPGIKLPNHFGHETENINYGMLHNDECGNCLAEGTVVSASGTKAALRTKYDGPMVTLSLVSGKRLTVTPKHGVLTTKGFASAYSIKNGDYLVGTCGLQKLPRIASGVRQIDFDYAPTKVEEIFKALALGSKAVRPVMPSSVDFHGDEKFFNGDVEIVWADSLLRDQLHAALGEPYAQEKIGTTSQLKGALVGAGALFLSSLRGWLSTYGNIGLGGYGSSLCHAHGGVAQSQGLGLRAQDSARLNNFFLQMLSGNNKFLTGALHRRSGQILTDGGGYIPVSTLANDSPAGGTGVWPSLVASGAHPLGEGCYTDPHLFGNLRQVFPGLVEADRVVNVDFQSRSAGCAHVYDLSTDCKWYIANGIVTHNCVIADIAHQIMIQAQATRRPVPTFNNTVLPIYSAITGYNANAPLDKNGDNPTDQGTDAAVAANWWQTKGIQDDQGSLHHSKAFGEIAVGDWDQLLKSIYLFGGASIGVQLPSTAASQFDAGQVWTVPSGRVDSLGGHMITGVGLNSKGNLVAITWGKTTAITRDWLERFMDEGVVSMSLEYITATGKSPELFDVIQLTTDLDTLTKR